MAVAEVVVAEVVVDGAARGSGVLVWSDGGERGVG